MRKSSVQGAALAVAMGLVCPALAVADAPVMSRDKPVSCYRDKQGLGWRVQCDDATRVCLYTPDAEIDSRGNRVRPLERARTCPVYEDVFDIGALQSQGYRVVRALPAAPHGWQRDERGRVFQVNFDLRRRVYIGASYSPRAIDSERSLTRTGVDIGLLVFEHYGGDDNPNRHRVRLVEGRAHLAPFAGQLVLAHYDISRRFKNPLLRITTFFGKARRSDLNFNVGAWVEAGHLEIHDTEQGDRSLWRLATAQATLDLWQSRDLYSFARVRAGAGFERAADPADWKHNAVTPGGALEANLNLDDRGFHHLAAEVTYDVPIELEGRERFRRFAARLQYEVIFLAINDQPLSVRLAASVQKRDDILGLPDDWAFQADAGLRFSLWAPPRQP